MNCKKNLLVSLLLAAAAAAEQTVSADVAKLSVRQSETIPLLESDDDAVVFSIEIAASCGDQATDPALVASIADTLVDAVAGADLATVAVDVAVPGAQLVGMQRALLCKRLAKTTTDDTRTLIRGAFNVQVVSICNAPGRGEQHRTVNAPLDVYIDCAANSSAGASPGN